MSSTESFDELEQKIAARMEDALSEIKEELLERLQGTREQLDQVVNSELVAAREEASAAASEAEEARFALLAEAEETKAAAVAEALEAKETEFAELLGARDAAIREIEQARDAALAEAEETRSALLSEAEESKSAAIAEALEAREAELFEALAAKDAALSEAEEAKIASLATAAEEREAAVAEAQSATEAAAAEAVIGTVLRLHEAISKIDAAQSQTEVLEALLAGSSAFASRSLLFLTQEDGLQGWGGQGFDTPEGLLQETHLDYSAGTAWEELAAGRGTVKMTGDACAEICHPVDGSMPEEGVLIPLVLRDRLAAALYADRLAEESPFVLALLQILTYVTGQALESLPMRQRSGTASLRLVTEVSAEEPGLELWQFLAPEEPLEETAPEFVEEPVAVPVEPAEPVVEGAFAEPPAPIEEIPEPPTEPWQEAAEEAGFEVEELVEAQEERVREEPAIEEPVVETVDEESAEVTEKLIEVMTPPEVEEPVAEIEAPTEVTAPPTEVAPPTQVAPPAAGAEVAAPEDVDGPGWAFTTRRFASEGNEDAGHEEARRLARLLVTEIKLYNEEQVEEGRRSRNVYRILKEDIDRSRQIYEERIEEAVRTETDYFQEELVKILAAGDADALGT